VYLTPPQFDSAPGHPEKENPSLIGSSYLRASPSRWSQASPTISPLASPRKADRSGKLTLILLPVFFRLLFPASRP
jgi:hypothetical protein